MYANITSPISDKQKDNLFDQYDALHDEWADGEPAYREDYDMYDDGLVVGYIDNGQWKYAQDIVPHHWQRWWIWMIWQLPLA